MEIHRYEIPYSHRGSKFDLFPLGDIHLGTKNCDKDKLQETIDYEIERRLPNHKKLQTLFHEILHAIAFEYGDIKIGETKIDLLATGLMSLFRDNPTLKHLL